MAVDGVEIISYPTWIYIEDYAIEGMEKEVQPDLNKTYKLALQSLPEKKEELRIGVQPSYLTPYAGQFLTDTFKEKILLISSSCSLRPEPSKHHGRSKYSGKRPVTVN